MPTMLCTPRTRASLGAMDAAPCCSRPSAGHRKKPEIIAYRRQTKRRERQRWKRDATSDAKEAPPEERLRSQ